MTVLQKLDMVLENKVVQKLKLENNVFTKNGLLTCYPEMKKKISVDLSATEFCQFFMSKIDKIFSKKKFI